MGTQMKAYARGLVRMSPQAWADLLWHSALLCLAFSSFLPQIACITHHYSPYFLARVNCATTCCQVLARLRGLDKIGLFWEPVTPDIAPDYADVIPFPMDMTTIASKIDGGQYDATPQVMHAASARLELWLRMASACIQPATALLARMTPA